VNPVAWYVARSAYQNVWQPVGSATEDGAVVGFAEWAHDESNGTRGFLQARPVLVMVLGRS
jgi:hypothetical protein